ncbi:unnamed protein product [Rhizophagus irregularis]|nr:unnamed protein product [Rhizophagus irregularis]
MHRSFEKSKIFAKISALFKKNIILRKDPFSYNFLIIFGTIYSIFMWTFAPGVKDDHLHISNINDKFYANYLDTFRQQHYNMLSNLINKANKALKNDSVYSVTLKPQLAPSNDPHDYMSLARYFWPDPNKPDGLPYMRKDGYSNPEIETIKDYSLLRKLFDDVENLGFAYYLQEMIHTLRKLFIELKNGL